MTEDEAQRWFMDRFGVAGHARIAHFLDAVVAENARQNLISPSSIPAIWARHAVDSAQLLDLAPVAWKTWLDVGTGGGFPGMVIALLAPDRRVTMVEPRAKRAAFLMSYATTAGVTLASVEQRKVQSLERVCDVISARAVSPVETLLRDAAGCSGPNTVWLLPRGRSPLTADHCDMFHVEHSITDPASVILVAGRPK